MISATFEKFHKTLNTEFLNDSAVSFPGINTREINVSCKN